MGIYDDVHDIRYLHDDKAPHDHEPTKLPDLRNILKYKRIGAIFGMFILVGGMGLLIFNISNPQETRSRASETSTETEVMVRGTVTCVKSENEDCNLAIVTDDGDTIEVDKTTIDTTKSLNEGDYVTVSGKITTTQSLIPSNSSKKITIENLQSLGTAKTPTPTKSQTVTNNVPVPTVDNTPLVTPTPTPQELKNNDPLPGIEYVTATYVVQNKSTLNGQTVNVQSFLVGGYIGVPGCDFEENCNVSHFLLNDFNAQERDTTLDLQVIGGTTDKEGDYAPGQEFFTTGKVHLDGESVYLEKIN